MNHTIMPFQGHHHSGSIRRRCQNCDGVRKLGYDQLSDEEKKKVKVVTKEYKKGLNPTARMFVPKDLSTISRGMQKLITRNNG